MFAFVPTTSLSFKSKSSTFTRSDVTVTSNRPNVSPLLNNKVRKLPVATLMSEDPGVSPSSSIDFSKVNISQAGSNFSGLVFTPESDSDSPLKTRVDVGYTPLQEAAVNAHINVEYTASYAYHALWSYFDRDVVALPGFAKYFLDQSSEERDHAHEFMQFQNRRGGLVELQPVAVPEMKFTMKDGTSDALYAMDLHLQLEKFVYSKLRDLHKVAEEANDPQMQDFVEEYLTHQIEAIKQAADYVSQIRRVGTPHGVYHIDLTLRGEEEKAAIAAN